MLKSRDYLVKSFRFVLLIGFISLGAIGGCGNDSDGGVPTNLKCGDSVGPEPPEKLESEQDTLNCSGTAITVEGPVMLDLNGNTISCDGSAGSVGIHVIGTSAKVLNGSVTNCEIGILVEGEGSHRIENMDASGNGNMMVEGAGILVNSDKNVLHQVTATMNQVFGVRVNGDRNKILESSVSENLFLGIVLYGSHNEVKDTDANNNLYTNIAITDALGGGNQNLIENNMANGSLENEGIYVGGDNNQVVNNEAINNFISGIDIRGQQNSIKNNTATGNLTASALGDVLNFHGRGLEDDNPECDDNTWSENDFVTSNAQGVQNPPCIQ